MDMDKEISKKEVKYNWFQISDILKLGYYDREVVKTKYFTESHTEKEWGIILKKDELTFKDN